jgi:hypothetical protein
VKKIFAVLILVAVFSALLLVGCTKNSVKDALTSDKSGIENSLSEEDLVCPSGIGHEPAPGSCPLYRDANNDGLCDYRK